MLRYDTSKTTPQLMRIIPARARFVGVLPRRRMLNTVVRRIGIAYVIATIIKLSLSRRSTLNNIPLKKYPTTPMKAAINMANGLNFVTRCIGFIRL